MGGFKGLYNFCQTLEPKISRNDILKKTLEITGAQTVKAVKTSLDITACRGMFLSPKNTNHRIVQQLGCNVILLARGQKYCWERFVYTKELMHLFDDDDEPTSTEEKLEKLLADLEVPSAELSKQALSEIKGFWMALACLCPEKNRLEFQRLREKNHIDNYGIALQLKIPEQYVPSLFRQGYLNIIQLLIK